MSGPEPSAPAAARGDAFRERAFAFRIDESRAFEKLRTHRVAEPERYVLEVVLAAQAAGATAIDVDPGVWKTTIAFDGQAFRQAELKGLYGHLLGDSREAESARLSHLASALVTLSHMRPRFVEVRSGRARLVECFDEDGHPSRTLEPLTVADAVPGTVIVVAKQRRFRLLQAVGWQDTDDEKVLRDRVMWCPVPIRIDGAPLRPVLPPLAVSIPIETEEVKGILGVQADYARSAPLYVCYQGILVETRTFQGIGGVLTSASLRRNISLNAVVKDASYDRLLQHATESRGALEIRLATHHLTHGDRHDPSGVVLRLLRPLLLTHPLPADHPLRAQLEALRVFRVGDRSLSLSELMANARETRPEVQLTDRPPPLLRRAARSSDTLPSRLDTQYVITMPPSSAKVLRTFIERVSRDVTRELRVAATFARRERARAAFEASPRRAPVIDYPVVVKVDIAGEHGEGQLGILGGGGKGVVRLLHRGHALGELPGAWRRGLVGLVESPDVRPTADFSRAKRDGVLESVVAMVAEGTAQLLAAALDGLKAELDADGLGSPVLLEIARGAATGADPALVARASELVRVPRLSGPPVPLADVRGGQWKTLASDSAPAILDFARRACDPARVLLLDEGTRALVQDDIGCLGLEAVDDQAALAVVAQVDPGRRYPDPAAAMPRSAPIDYRRQHPECLVLLAADPQGFEGPAGLVWIRDRIAIEHSDHRDTAWLFPGVCGVVQSPELPVDLSWSHVPREHPTIIAAKEHVKAGVVALITEAHRTNPERARLLVLGWLVYHFEATYDTEAKRRTLVPRVGLRSSTGAWGPIALAEERELPGPDWLDVPLVDCLDGERRSIAALLEATGARTVPFTHQVGGSPIELDGHPAVVQDGAALRLLVHLLPLREIDAKVAAARARHELLTTTGSKEPHFVDNTDAYSIEGVTASTGRIHGRLRLRSPAHLEILFRGATLAELDPEVEWAAVQAIVSIERLPETGGEQLLSKARVATIRRLVAAEAPKALAERCAGYDDRLPEGLRHRLVSYLAEAFASTRLAPRLRSVLTTMPEGPKDPWRQVLLRAPTFLSVSWPEVSLRDLHLREGPLRYVPDGPGERAPHRLCRPEWLRLSVREVRLLDAVFPERELVDMQAQLERQDALDLFRASAPPVTLDVVPPDAIFGTRLSTRREGRRITGVLWLPGERGLEHGEIVVAYEGREAARVVQTALPIRMEARVTMEGLSLDASSRLRRDEPWDRLIGAVNAAGLAMVCDLAERIAKSELDPARASQGRSLVLAVLADAWCRRREVGIAALTEANNAPIFERADGLGHVSLRALFADHEADGEVGFLRGRTADPERLGRELAVVVHDAADDACFAAIFGVGWVDYSARIESSRSASRLRRVSDLLDKTIRVIEDDSVRAMISAWPAQLEIGDRGDGRWVDAVGDRISLDSTHASHGRLDAALDRGADPSLGLLSAIGQARLAPDDRLRLIHALAVS